MYVQDKRQTSQLQRTCVLNWAITVDQSIQDVSKRRSSDHAQLTEQPPTSVDIKLNCWAIAVDQSVSKRRYSDHTQVTEQPPTSVEIKLNC
jgi:hypothetical protein